MIASKRVRLYENLDYQLDVEYNKDYVIFHLPLVNKFSKGVFLDMLCKLDELYTMFNTMGHQYVWAAVDPNNQKVNRLLVKLGFKYAGSADGMSVYNYGGY